MTPINSPYVLDDKVNGATKTNAAANYRVGLWPESQFATKDGATAALRWERRIELGMEGHRWFDLCRWGVAPSVLSSYISYETQHLIKYAIMVYPQTLLTLPFPRNEIINMGGRLVMPAHHQ